MAYSYACLTLQRVVLPIVLVLAALYRPVGISFVYLLMFFISPFVPVATKYNFTGSVAAYLFILIALSTILILCHIGLQLSILALHIGDQFGNCSVIERLLRHIGFIAYQNLKPLAVIEWLAPEVVVFITSLTVYIICKKLTQTPEIHIESGDSDATIRENSSDSPEEFNSSIARQRRRTTIELIELKLPNFDGLIKISPLFCLATLFFSAVLRPSVPGGFYFIIFLMCGSYWAMFKTLQKKFALILRLLMIVIIVHTICFVAYQTPWMQEHLDKNSLAARLVGLEPLVTSTCEKDIRIIIYDTSYKIDSFLNPIVLLFTYYSLALTTKNLSKLKVTIHRDQQRPQNKIEPTETTPLMSSTTIKPPSLTTDDINTTSGNGPGKSNSNPDIPLENLEGSPTDDALEKEYKSSILDQIVYGITGVGGFIYQNSYIFTNVLMMAWSIIYHSWLTFVLLLWANVLWMIPNQRKAMMRSSIFIVIYAELLIIAQYIYGMNLNNSELPSKVNITGINLSQIGFDRPMERGIQPCIPLIVKTLFLLMFWVTLRQFFKEKTEKRRNSTLADMFAPLHVSVRPAGVNGANEDDANGVDKYTSKFLRKIGTIIKNLLVRLWIWLLILVIFLCAMTGDKMTGFRICYMALFLFFLLVFQSSSKAWVRLMYGFWLFLIFYAMSILILIYTYQFDKFDEYWEYYLNISDTLQTDIGLERYQTKDLLLHFISPTIIVILTVIQVHYFHKLFIHSMTRLPKSETEEQDVQPKIHRKMSFRADYDTTDFTESAGQLVRLFLKRFRSRSEKFFKQFKGVFWSILELHWIKIVYITAFVCAVSEVCLLHLPFVVLCVVGIISNVRMRIFFSRVISLVVTLIVLSKMIYQIKYMDHENYVAKCEVNGVLKEVGNNAKWFGLTKADKKTGLTLMDLLKKYIIYMVIATLHAVISLRQYQMRRLRGTLNDPLPKVPFPTITRDDAEHSLEGAIKYLLNYSFYKFGFEMCMIALVSTITYRQDVVALIYSFWVIVLLLFRRRKIARIWGVFQIFLVISIIVQYIIMVQVPPKMCMKYIWENSRFSHAMQAWAMLPGQLNYDHRKKLVFDFILLLLVNRQKRVFSIENIPHFPGGSNSNVVKHIANLGKVDFVNPTHDFLTKKRNYLDVFKHAILCGFYWTTLAVVFLAGTNIVDFLALGYLIGAFLFLWEGSDFYTRPIRSIIRRWRVLIAYNVANIVIKTTLQVAGCLFMTTLRINCCWLVHVLGINCASMPIYIDKDDDDLETICPPTKAQTVLLWDAICFAFLLFQLRIFKSYYICHIITDTRANNILASRGAEIIGFLRKRQFEKRKFYEEQILQKIKRKMEKIRATQQKMLKPTDRPTHFDDHGNPIQPPKPHKGKEIRLHPDAIRAGDYWMFEDVEDKFELDWITDPNFFIKQDNENMTVSEMKMNRRKTLYDESFKPKADVPEPSTSRGTEPQGPKAKPKTDVDSADVTEKDSDEDFDANPIVRLMEGFLVSLTIKLNRFSRNYRYCNKILEEEKRTLKESNNLYMFSGQFSGRNAATIFNMMKQNTLSKESLPNSNKLVRPKGGKEISMEEEEDFTARDHNIVVEVLISTWYAILSNTDLICYIVIFVNQVVNASLISLPLPLMIFLWGTLSLPRPSKTFWVTLIAYTQAIVLIKCIFQFKLIWVNYNYNLPNNPLGIDKLFGIQMIPEFATYDLLLLLVLFFHRYILKSHGLWKIDNYKRETNDNDNQERLNEDLYSEPERKSPPPIRRVHSSTELAKRVEEFQRKRYLCGLQKFFYSLLHKPRMPADVYALMFLCDFVNFFVLLFGFTAFSSKRSDGGVKTYLEENKVPVPFLIMLLVQFLLIIIDRALYMRKALKVKIIFHFISVVGIHVWMFFIVPAVTERSFYESTPPIMFYIIKCFYLLLSSYQIKCGYPPRIYGNVLCKSFSLVNMIFFKIYKEIPFLDELRTILDWLCTDTTMTLFDWLKMEDIFSQVFSIKCIRQMETDFPTIRAIKKPTYIKLMMGGAIILFIVFLIWGPLTLFALSNAVGQSNVPIEVKISVRIGSYEPIYVTSTREATYVFTDEMFSDMKNAYIKEKDALSFLMNYDASDVAAISISGNSPTVWNIAPPDKDRLLSELQSDSTLTIRLSYELTRTPPTKGQSGTVSKEITVEVGSNFTYRSTLAGMLGGANSVNQAVIPNIVPKFIKVLNSGDPIHLKNLLVNSKSPFTDLAVSVNNDKNVQWWEISDYCTPSDATEVLQKLPSYSCSAGIVLYTFNDKKFPSTWTFITAGGIIGIYTTFVLVASRFLKSFLGGQNAKIMYEDLPNVDRILQLCLDIYLVREALEFMLEEDLFAKLIFLYRSPETLIKWTRPHENVEDDTDTESVRSRISSRREHHNQ